MRGPAGRRVGRRAPGGTRPTDPDGVRPPRKGGARGLRAGTARPPDAVPPLLALLLCLSPAAARAQGFRGELVTSMSHIQMRPLTLDSVSRSEVIQRGGGLFFGEIPVACQTGETCTFFRAGGEEGSTTLTQDLKLTGWGFGLVGLSAHVHARFRDDVGSDFTFPRAADELDLLEGYLQYNRSIVRARAGRLRLRSGLGTNRYDGASVLVEPRDWIRIEGYGGRSLARALNEPRNEALRGAGDLFPDLDAYLVGTSLGIDPLPGTSLTARYQREIWSDGSALVSERASLDLRTDLLDPVEIEASADWDFAFGRAGKAHATARLPLLEDRIALEATARRYIPYFELWTIWGLFSPVAYNAGEFRVSWYPDPRYALWVAGGFREYEDSGTDPILGPVEDDAWDVGGGIRFRPEERLRIRGDYRAERGVGAFLSQGELSVGWRPLPRLWLDVHGTASQQIEEFRIGEGMVRGGGVSTEFSVLEHVTLSGGVSLYRQDFDNRPGEPDWDQLRAWSSLRIGVGGDPGLRGRFGR